MLDTQKKIFKILTAISLGLFLVMFLIFGAAIVLLGDQDLKEILGLSFIEVLILNLFIVASIFIYYKMYKFKKVGMNLFIPSWIIAELLNWYDWEPMPIEDQFYWLDTVIVYGYVIGGILFTLMFLTDMKKEFQ